MLMEMAMNLFLEIPLFQKKGGLLCSVLFQGVSPCSGNPYLSSFVSAIKNWGW